MARKAKVAEKVTATEISSEELMELLGGSDEIDHYETLATIASMDIDIEARRIVYNPIGEHGDNEQISMRNIKELLVKFRYLEKLSNDPIFIEMSTYGGDLTATMIAHDAIAASKCEVTILATGAVMSGGAILLQAAKHRLIAKHTVFMMHDLAMGIADSRLNDAVQYLAVTKAQMHMLYELFAERNTAGKDVKYFKKNFVTDFWLTAKDAVANGFADKIV